MTEQALALLVNTLPEASALIGRVLNAVHEDLSRLLNEENLQLCFLELARHRLAGKDEAAELQV